MREFVRNYFLRNSASLVNKDLTSISAELQAAYEKETATGDGAADSVGDRKPVFCRTFIQKVARSLGFILTLHFGLVDKRMKHLMKIRKRGKKNSKKVQPTAQHPISSPNHSSNNSTSHGGSVDKQKAETKQHQQHEQHIKHEQQSALLLHPAVEQHLVANPPLSSAAVDVSAEVAAAAHHMEEMAASLEVGVRGGRGEASGGLVKEESLDDVAVEDDDDDEGEAADDGDDDGNDSDDEVEENAADINNVAAGDNTNKPHDSHSDTRGAGTKMDE